MLVINGAIAVFNGFLVKTCRFWCECVRGGVLCNGECRCDEGECCNDEWKTEPGFCCGDQIWSPENDPDAPCEEGWTFLQWGDEVDQCCGCVPPNAMNPELNGGIEGAENVAAALCCPACDGIVFRDQWGECPVRCCEDGNCAHKKPSECTGTQLGGCCELGCPVPCCSESPDGSVVYCSEVTAAIGCAPPSKIDSAAASCEQACKGACCVDTEEGYVLHENSPLTKDECDAVGGEFQGVGADSCILCEELFADFRCREPFDNCCCEEKTSNGAGLTFYQPRNKRLPPFSSTTQVTVEFTSKSPIRIHGDVVGGGDAYENCAVTTVFLLCWDAFNVEPVPCGSNFNDLKIKVCWRQFDTSFESLSFSGCNNITVWLGNCLYDCETVMIYSGPGHTSNASIEMRGDGVIRANGTGPIVLTSSIAHSGSCDRTLTLDGSSDQANEVRTILDPAGSAVCHVVKDGIGRWRFNAASRVFQGDLTVKNGTLQVGNAGSLGNIVLMGGDNGAASLLLEQDITVSIDVVALPGSQPVIFGSMSSTGQSTMSSGQIRTGSPVTLVAKTGGTFDFRGSWSDGDGNDPADNDVIIGAAGYAGTVRLSSSGELETTGSVSLAFGTARLGVSTKLIAGGGLTLASGTTLLVTGTSSGGIDQATTVTANSATMTIQSPSGESSVSQSLDELVVAGTLTLNGSGSLTVADLSGDGGIVNENGTLTLNQNSMTGSMSITGGTVIVNEPISSPGDLVLTATFTSSTLTVEFSGDPDPESEYVLLAGPTVQSYAPSLTGTQVKAKYESETSTLVIAAAPADITLSSSSVEENAPIGTTVGTLSTIDADIEDPAIDDTFTYTIVSGSGFSIAGASLQTSQSFNFESQHSATVRIRSTDSSGFYVEKDFEISITDVNEAPTNITLSLSTVASGAAVGTAVGTFSTADVDAGDTFTYSLVPGFGGNSSFSISGSQLLTAAVFDSNVQSSYSIRVRSTDSGGLSFEKTFTITIT
jgi:autotransporter-associated beta strand protein